MRTLSLLCLSGLAVVSTATAQVEVQSSLTDADFAHIRAGTFTMGDARVADTPPHSVTLTHGFWMQKTLVTQAQWEAVMGSNPSNHRDCATCPVENMDYDQVQAFIAALNERTPGRKYRLPTEAEWEYAARAGMKGDYGVPGAITSSGWITDNSGGHTHPVGELRPNAWGLYDMAGNVWEWVNDWYSPYPTTAVTNPTGPASDRICDDGHGCHVLRGGSYIDDAFNARSAIRLPVAVSRGALTTSGFRLARTDLAGPPPD